jgi:hypothetical protein
VEDLIKMYLEETIEDVVEVTENEEVIKQEPILSEEDADLSAKRRARHGITTRRRRHRERDRVSSQDGGGDDSGDGGGESIGQLDFVGELNGSNAPDSVNHTNNDIVCTILASASLVDTTL